LTVRIVGNVTGSRKNEKRHQKTTSGGENKIKHKELRTRSHCRWRPMEGGPVNAKKKEGNMSEKICNELGEREPTRSTDVQSKFHVEVRGTQKKSGTKNNWAATSNGLKSNSNVRALSMGGEKKP